MCVTRLSCLMLPDLQALGITEIVSERLLVTASGRETQGSVCSRVLTRQPYFRIT